MLVLCLGFVAFIVLAVCFFVNPWIEIRWQEVAVFSAFFAGAILCLGFSFLFHTVYCHSEQVGYIFGKYVGFVGSVCTFYHPRSEGGIVLHSVCDFVCLSVGQHYNL